MNDEPSPYVGHIDLQRSLQQATSNPSTEEDAQNTMADGEEHIPLPGAENDVSRLQAQLGKQRKRRRATVAPPDGSYRIPEQGQLQIIIKNPNKTAVKLFFGAL